jgi:UDP:flavonoid glycosyltransferase YjiC (YdhE family)
MPLPDNVRFAGPILDGPPLLRSVDEAALSSGAEPLVVVSFSTSDQGQVPLLQRCIDALASVAARAIVTTGPAVDPVALQPARNVHVMRFVPHDRLFPRASLVVTHAGLGTIMTALAHGVPMLCAPFGRDQFFNAARRGARRRPGDSSRRRRSRDRRCRAAAARRHARASATRMAGVIAGYRNGACAIDELERVARRGCGVRLVHAE